MNNTKESVINIRCTEIQKSRIQKCAEHEQMTVSQYILYKVLEKPLDSETFKKIMQDSIEWIEIINEIFRLICKNGNEDLLEQVKRLLQESKAGENK